MLYKIQISEPWEFEHPNGSNGFTAEGIGIVPGPKDVPNFGDAFFLLHVQEPFQFAGDDVVQILCAPRYEGVHIDSIPSSKCTVGIARVRPGFTMTDSSAVIPDQTHYFAIGSISPSGVATTNNPA